MAAYTVKPGDTLAAIARRNGTTVSELLRLNPKLTTDARYQGGKIIFSGTKVNLPAAPAAPVTPVQTPLPDTIRIVPNPPTPAPNPPTSVYRPSDLAAQESGAIGAASIASQMAKDSATPTPTPLPDTTKIVPNPPTPEDTGVGKVDSEIKDEKKDVGGDLRAEPELQLPGTTEDAAALFEAGRERADAIAKAQNENALTLRTLQAQYEPQIRGAERSLYTSQMRALADLARRGFTGATGLAEASQRAYAVAPLQARIDTLGKLLSAQQAAGVLLPEQLAQAQRDFERALNTSRKAIGISNKLGGRNG